jgi:hypothetical protein
MPYRELSGEEEQHYETAHDLLEELEALGVEFRLVDGKVRFKPASRVGKVGKAALERYKGEIYELLREEAECNARWESLLASQPETEYLPDDEDAAWNELQEEESEPQEEESRPPSEQQMALFRWIDESLEAAPLLEVNRRDSYHLKHVFERSPEGFYVTDAQFRAAMWFSGYLGRCYPGKRYEDLESRYYYVQPNREGFARKLVNYAGVPEGWAREAMG